MNFIDSHCVFSMPRLSVILFICAFTLTSAAASAKQNADGPSASALAKASGPPSFFIRDRADGQCLAGAVFKRCGIDTLWFVEGKPGAYKLHRRLVDETDIEECLDKSQCHTDESPARLSNCNHCGAQKWNILGDEERGYYITQDRERYCLMRYGNNAIMSSCDTEPVRYTVKFATKREVGAMGSDGARFVAAAADGDMDAVMALLQRKVSPDTRNWEQRTPLLAAAAAGNVDMLRYLVGKRADLTLADRDDVTVLAEAVIGNHAEAVRFLLSLPSSRDILDSPAASGASPLWFAAAEGKLDIVSLLVAAGANVNSQRLDGITPIIAAAAGGHTAVASTLLVAGADVLHRTGTEGLTALLAACENGSLPLVVALIEAGAEINTLSTAGFSPLIVAAANGFDDIVRLLLLHGADPNQAHPEDITALMYAAAGGHGGAAKLLLSTLPSGLPASDVNRRHKLGGSALMEAATKGDVDVYQLLIDHGADSSIVDKDGVTILMTAASHGRDELIGLILAERGASLDIDQLSDSGGTALMYAAGGGHAATCRLLLTEGRAHVDIRVKADPAYIARVEAQKTNASSGADVPSTMLEVSEVEHSGGGTALTVAAEGGFTGVVEVLVEGGADIHVLADDNHSALTYSFMNGHADIVLFLLQRGANPNINFTDKKGVLHDMLHDSIIGSNVSVALELINRGAAVTHLDEDGSDILAQAAVAGLRTVMSALLARVDLNWAPLHQYLILAASEGHSEVVALLLLHKQCNVCGVDPDGTNALMAASARGHMAVVKMLLMHPGICIDAQNVDGHTALMFAHNGISQVLRVYENLQDFVEEERDGPALLRGALHEYQNIIELLLSSGANAAIQDHEGHIASDFNILTQAAEMSDVDQSDGISGAYGSDL